MSDITSSPQYASSSLLMDISATLREPVLKNTRKAIVTSNITFFRCVVEARICSAYNCHDNSVYAAVAITNYGALGNAAQGDVLTNYSDPSWLIVVANFAVCVVNTNRKQINYCYAGCAAPASGVSSVCADVFCHC